MKKKILIIDDDIMTLRMLKKHLENDYEIQLENAGYRFVEHIADYRVDMILLDIEMPVMNGLDVFDVYLKQPHEDIPVIFLSGVSNPQIVREAMEKGAAGYLLKTAPKGELIAKLKQIYYDYAGSHEKPHILILGNDVTLVRITKLDLEEGGYRPSCVFSIAETLDILKQETVDALLILEPILNVSEQEIYETLCKKLGVRAFPAIYGHESYTKELLLDKVGKAVGR
ncbi:MAG: response regulator [Lachnospiraceae bacterium]|nr:response regulator [Lachnospiraceae bacterium]